jgi:hypothetical protein
MTTPVQGRARKAAMKPLSCLGQAKLIMMLIHDLKTITTKAKRKHEKPHHRTFGVPRFAEG